MDSELQKLFDTLGAQSQKAAQTLADVTATGADDDDLVTATVGAGNLLVDIVFDPRARRLDTHDLRERVLVATKRASEACQEQVQRILAEQAGSMTGIEVPGIGDLRRQMQEAQEQLEEQKRRMEDLAAKHRAR
ncbi:YbaB/EbfC family nucleoid-associated protein [Nocardioides hwasunensis]|uniref:YbaB/EbfC family nucleoid-associated protein n=1 Tax=Nocardioides hwasunensis TaxID=397258 RepID=A0ABR8MLY9_9ACTN|nr:YbaB/EbfC family nucleoid-associated protein [Nocardioides hwasunensis]MBD3915539.1 YbaB/EbfC family nucleoid-associated protein [Nocardioides hwasunensis]